ncbi:zinc-dependent metalloprotease [Streptomyces sp. NPDC058469]|uniref:zinc-dependent metalloprotease n=1 Tax=Streptomyces sp. NPDC058469 TaxID=3346514 RepID=UPI00364D6514
MYSINVQDDTGSNEELAGQITTMLTNAAPYVEKSTGLPLPETVAVTLVDREGLGTALSAFARRQAERETEGVKLTAAQQRRVDLLPMVTRTAAHHFWMTDESELISNSMGRPTSLLVPESLEHQGLNTPDQLLVLLVRALAKQAQVAACEGNLIPPLFYPIVQPSQDAVTALSDGHARWTSNEVTPLILGRAVVRNQRRRPGAYLGQRLLGRLLSACEERRIRGAVTFVGQSLSAVGPERFNRVWSVDGLVPTLVELRRPAQWASRVPA